MTRHPTGAWVAQQARNPPIDHDEHADRLRFLIRDRDATFSDVFDAVFAAAGVEVPRDPPTNAEGERVPGTLGRRGGCLDRMLILGERHLHALLAEHARHYNERLH